MLAWFATCCYLHLPGRLYKCWHFRKGFNRFYFCSNPCISINYSIKLAARLIPRWVAVVLVFWLTLLLLLGGLMATLGLAAISQAQQLLE